MKIDLVLTRMVKMAVALALALPTPAFAGGGWGSSGGESFRDSHNPWFIQSTPVVHYCVKIDHDGFSADDAVARRLITRAIGYWKEQFLRLRVDMQTKFPAEVATQEFVEVACGRHDDSGVDLTFQLGYGTLDQRQREFLEDPRRHIGIAVRTDYDEVNLRGRGFVFISSDRGPNRFDADTVGSASPFVEAPWQYEGLLYRVLLHELGHVFGIPHVGTSVRSYTNTHGETRAATILMSEEFPEELVRRENYAAFLGSLDVDPFFMPRTSFSDCQLSEHARRYFGLAASQTCVHARFDIRTTAVEVDLTSSAGLSGPRTPLGHATWKDWDKDGSKLDMQLTALVRLTSAQRVFTFADGKTPPFVAGAMMVGLDFPLTLRTPDGQGERRVYFRLAPQTYEVIGQADGGVMLLLDGR